MTESEGGEKMPHRILQDVHMMRFEAIRRREETGLAWEGQSHDRWADDHEAMFEMLREANNYVAWYEMLLSHFNCSFQQRRELRAWADQLESLCGIPAFWRKEKDG